MFIRPVLLYSRDTRLKHLRRRVRRRDRVRHPRVQGKSIKHTERWSTGSDVVWGPYITTDFNPDQGWGTLIVTRSVFMY